MNNDDFLRVIANSFREFVNSGTSRSTAKLKPLHGAIAANIAERLGKEYEVCSQGYKDDRESDIQGRYIDKKVDITIKHQGKAIAGIGVKFVMQNYSQNSNNYFENMLGETANIRCSGSPYFQVFIILDRLPYYNNEREIKKWETFSRHNVEKYTILADDNSEMYLHTPDKTLIYIVHIPDNDNLKNKTEYMEYYRNHIVMTLSENRELKFGNGVVLNDYETFITKVYHKIKSL